jgi:hypothetical protein
VTARVNGLWTQDHRFTLHLACSYPVLFYVLSASVADVVRGIAGKELGSYGNKPSYS